MEALSFHLFLFLFMLISNNNILFTTICVHSVCLFFIIFYSYLIFIRNCDSKIICFFGSAFIGLLSSSFLPRRHDNVCRNCVHTSDYCNIIPLVLFRISLRKKTINFIFNCIAHCCHCKTYRGNSLSCASS